jgi:hypothetical protein
MAVPPQNARSIAATQADQRGVEHDQIDARRFCVGEDWPQAPRGVGSRIRAKIESWLGD